MKKKKEKKKKEKKGINKFVVHGDGLVHAMRLSC
jgi:hypothetical protein